MCAAQTAALSRRLLTHIMHSRKQAVMAIACPYDEM
eukprot:COSAG01_NODE_54531_length_331_cov_1.112069_2_plen_35_part_01